VCAALVSPRGWALSTDEDKAFESPAVVVTVRTEPLRGEVTALSMAQGATLHVTGGDAIRIPVDELVRINFDQPSPPPRADAWAFRLASGDLVVGQIESGGPDAILVNTYAAGKVRVSLEQLDLIRTPHAEEPQHRQSAQWFERESPGSSDRVLLTNGDVLTGFVMSLDEDSLSFEGPLGEGKIQQDLVVAIRWSALRADLGEGLSLIFSVARTGKFTLEDVTVEDGWVQGRWMTGDKLRISTRAVRRIDVSGGRWEWLSNLRPVSAEHIPMLAMDWEYAPNRNVLGGPLRVGGDTFDMGIGVHSRSSLTFELAGKYQEFVTSFGMDDDSGPLADVAVAVIVDGKRRLEREHVRAGTLHGPVRIEVGKADRLELLVDYGDNGDIQDRFNWIEAALVR